MCYPYTKLLYINNWKHDPKVKKKYLTQRSKINYRSGKPFSAGMESNLMKRFLSIGKSLPWDFRKVFHIPVSRT